MRNVAINKGGKLLKYDNKKKIHESEEDFNYDVDEVLDDVESEYAERDFTEDEENNLKDLAYQVISLGGDKKAAYDALADYIEENGIGQLDYDDAEYHRKRATDGDDSIADDRDILENVQNLINEIKDDFRSNGHKFSKEDLSSLTEYAKSLFKSGSDYETVKLNVEDWAERFANSL
jgi:hypothetical protein